MIIYLALLIPVLAVGVLLLFFKHKMAWWEFSIPLVVSILLVIISKAISDGIQTRDTEYWGGIVKQAVYYEDWDEYISRTCTRSVPCGTDSKGNTTYCTETYDCSYVDYHPAYWEIITTGKEELRISESRYRQLVKRFGNEQFVELNRDYHRDDGDKYISMWDGQEQTGEPTVTVHTYENRVQASKDVYNYPKVLREDVKAYGLFDYPEVNGYSCNSILGAKDAKAEKKLRYINGLLGPRKQVRIWLLVFNRQPLQAGLTQEAYWKGGNKNEFIVAVGKDSLSKKASWCHVFSWTEIERLKIDTRYFVEHQDSLDLSLTADFLRKNIEKSFVRKQFADFNYLTIEPSLTAVVATFILTALVNVGLSTWCVMNGIE